MHQFLFNFKLAIFKPPVNIGRLALPPNNPSAFSKLIEEDIEVAAKASAPKILIVGKNSFLAIRIIPIKKLNKPITVAIKIIITKTVKNSKKKKISLQYIFIYKKR